ncbi:MAG: toprim domain-containing protein, partial [Deltaproteobacteria bacterium]|nr:toprim domain-containing protein [Deltaproteobacteria bacterium]
MIEKETIEAIKSGVDLRTYIESRGIPLKKNGRGYVGLCPFHQDTKPSLSVNIEKQLWQCFGCGAAGDVFRFVELYDKLKFPLAVEKLHHEHPHLKPLPAQPDQPEPLPEPKIQQLLDRVISIYENNLENTGKKVLYDRGIADAGLFGRHRIGYCNGKLKEILPQTGPIIEELGRIGILNSRGGEHFSGCLVFPVFDLDGNIVTIYGRFFHQATRRHVFLPHRSTGCWNIWIIKSCSDIILTESIMDALSIETAGYSNVISIQGTNGLSNADIGMFKAHGVSRITLLLDGDDPGREAALRIKERLPGFDITIKTLPDGHDPNSFLMANGADSLAGFIASESEPVAPKNVPDTPALSSLTAPDSAPDIRPAPDTGGDGFTVSFGLRKYRVMGLEKGARKLKCTVRIEHAGRLHVDTLDFYSARARRALAQDICRVFNEAPETIEADITRLMQACENAANAPRQEKEASGTVIVAGREKQEAETF